MSLENSKTKIKYSFIIPVKEINNYIRESISVILQIKRNDFEVIIYPDNKNQESWSKTKQIATGPVGPAQKRNLAIKDAQGEILIFIDDDAYPKNKFLAILDKNFKDENIVAVGGPALTPNDNNLKQKTSGAVFLSPLSGGCPDRYIPIGSKKFINDWPSVNFSVRKSKFIEVNGFCCDYWPGEDTKLCLDLINKDNSKILYDPDLIVWHHRREGFLKHLKQVGGYGLHRGFFAKKYPQTSFKFKYFMPSFFLTFIIIGAIISLFSSFLLKLYLLGWLIYSIAIIKALFDINKHEKNHLILLNSIYYIFFTHLIYGLRFIQGFLFVRELKSKLR